MKSAEIKDISIKDLQERIETEKVQLILSEPSAPLRD